jgi:hypothetical protein
MSVTIDRRPSGAGPALPGTVTENRVDRVHEGPSTPAPSLAPRTGDDRVLAGTRALLVAFLVFTALAVVSLLSGRTQSFFAWSIPSRAHATVLGAAYAAGFVLSALALAQRRWSAVRVPVVTVTAFTFLTLVPTLLHLHRFHMMETGTARLAAWVWLVVYLAVPFAGVAVVVRQEREGWGPDLAPTRPMPAPLAALLVVQGTALAGVGAVLYTGGTRVHEAIEMDHPGWPWAVTPLTSMVIGAWLLSFGVAISLAVRARDLAGMLVPAVAYAAFGAFELVVLLAHRTAPGTHPGYWWGMALVLASLVPTGIYGAWAAGPAPAGTRA